MDPPFVGSSPTGHPLGTVKPGGDIQVVIVMPVLRETARSN